MSPIGDRLYGSPPWRSFYTCASSRAALHVGSPCLRIGQPSNAPPLLLSPPGLTTRRGPPSKTRLGRCPKTPVAGCAGYGLICGRSRKSIRTAHRIAPKVAAGVSALSPHPLSRWRERGSDGLIKSGRQFSAWGMLGLAESQAADPWLWLAGLSVCSKREGVPLPRSGGGWGGADAPAAPYKHRLAHAPGRRSRSGRAFRCVGVLGQRPKRVLLTFARTKVSPRRAGVLTQAS